LYQRVAGKPEDDYEQVRYPDFRYSTQETTIFGGTAAHNPLINRA
jgi:hypothetical protein